MTRIYSNTQKHYQQLSAAERGQIEASLKDGLSVMQIAQRLGRARSTIY
ncbi:helix-turn-helix domain-containing protein, partial [Ligilactobacillus pobuzihii]